jgi:hypothetical protein
MEQSSNSNITDNKKKIKSKKPNKKDKKSTNEKKKKSKINSSETKTLVTSDSTNYTSIADYKSTQPIVINNYCINYFIVN